MPSAQGLGFRSLTSVQGLIQGLVKTPDQVGQNPRTQPQTPTQDLEELHVLAVVHLLGRPLLKGWGLGV
jgi:hypothetical protein